LSDIYDRFDEVLDRYEDVTSPEQTIDFLTNILSLFCTYMEELIADLENLCEERPDSKTFGETIDRLKEKVREGRLMGMTLKGFREGLMDSKRRFL